MIFDILLCAGERHAEEDDAHEYSPQGSAHQYPWDGRLIVTFGLHGLDVDAEQHVVVEGGCVWDEVAVRGGHGHRAQALRDGHVDIGLLADNRKLDRDGVGQQPPMAADGQYTHRAPVAIHRLGQVGEGRIRGQGKGHDGCEHGRRRRGGRIRRGGGTRRGGHRGGPLARGGGSSAAIRGPALAVAIKALSREQQRGVARRTGAAAVEEENESIGDLAIRGLLAPRADGVVLKESLVALPLGALGCPRRVGGQAAHVTRGTHGVGANGAGLEHAGPRRTLRARSTLGVRQVGAGHEVGLARGALGRRARAADDGVVLGVEAVKRVRERARVTAHHAGVGPVECAGGDVDGVVDAVGAGEAPCALGAVGIAHVGPDPAGGGHARARDALRPRLQETETADPVAAADDLCVVRQRRAEDAGVVKLDVPVPADKVARRIGDPARVHPGEGVWQQRGGALATLGRRVRAADRHVRVLRRGAGGVIHARCAGAGFEHEPPGGAVPGAALNAADLGLAGLGRVEARARGVVARVCVGRRDRLARGEGADKKARTKVNVGPGDGRAVREHRRAALIDRDRG